MILDKIFNEILDENLTKRKFNVLLVSCHIRNALHGKEKKIQSDRYCPIAHTVHWTCLERTTNKSKTNSNIYGLVYIKESMSNTNEAKANPRLTEWLKEEALLLTMVSYLKKINEN